MGCVVAFSALLVFERFSLFLAESPSGERARFVDILRGAEEALVDDATGAGVLRDFERLGES
jgi:hypothetical protein